MSAKSRKPVEAPPERPLKQTAIDILASWCEGDEEDEREQRETMQYLRKALDEGRRPGFKLFE
jgi:hypothetical protein